MISVVIPTLNAERSLGPCLAALGEAVLEPMLAEVIFADGGSADDTREIAEAVGARFVEAPRGRGPQLRAGAEAARGEWLLFLHADTVLPAGWVAAAQRHIASGPAAAGWFRLGFDQPGLTPKFVAGWANLRSRLGLPYGDQGLLIHRSLYREAGGYPDVPLMEDVSLARALGRSRLARIEATAVTSAEKYRRNGWLRQGARNLATLARYGLGASPEALARSYYR